MFCQIPNIYEDNDKINICQLTSENNITTIKVNPKQLDEIKLRKKMQIKDDPTNESIF